MNNRTLNTQVLRLAAAVVSDRAAAAQRRRRHAAELAAEVRARAEEERLLQAEQHEVRDQSRARIASSLAAESVARDARDRVRGQSPAIGLRSRMVLIRSR